MSRDHVESVAGAGLILAAFLQPPHHFGVTDLSRITGLTKNRTFRLLQTLTENNLVVKDPLTKEYALGFRLIELGAAATRSFGLARVASPVLDRLEADTDETVNLVIRADNYSSMCLARRATRAVPKVSGGVGSRFSLHVGASSKLLLAYSPPDVIETYIQLNSPLRALTPFTIIDPDVLRAELEQIRRLDYSVADQEISPGVWVVAAPVRDAHGHVIASLSISAPTSRAGIEKQQWHTELAICAAKEISYLVASSPDFAEPLLAEQLPTAG